MNTRIRDNRSWAAVKVLDCLVLSSLFLLLSLESLQGAEWVVGAVSSLTTIFPETPPAANDIDREITLKAARGEAESAQVVIVAGEDDLEIKRVEVSDLRKGGERIGSNNIDVRLVAYVEIRKEENSWRGIRRPGLWPDPLLRFRPFKCPAGQARSLWVTVKVPRSATPGRYEGSIRLYSEDNEEASIPIELTVWNFSLPKLPEFRTSYWIHLDGTYDLSKRPEVWMRTIKLFGEYRISTDLWPFRNFRDPQNMRDWVVLWYLEEDGSITCDISGIKRTIQTAMDAGFGTFQIGHGCWMGSEIDQMSLIERKTGRLLTHEDKVWKAALSRIEKTLDARQKDGFPGTYFARSFLPQMCDWLESKGILENSYMQLYDEAIDPVRIPQMNALYKRFRSVEPRLKLLGLVGIHPSMQGAYDIWSPFMQFYDPPTYDMIREGTSLRGPKNVKAKLSASSSGTYEGGSQFHYRPSDAYDGCNYSKWGPAKQPTMEKHQWLRFDFDEPQRLDGIRVVPFPFLPWDRQPADSVWFIEGTIDGERFEPLPLIQRAGIDGACSFPLRTYKAIRITHAKQNSKVVPAGSHAALVLNSASSIMKIPGVGPAYVTVADGIREVEFLRAGMPLEATRKRDTVRPAEIWEYQVGAFYPSACIDANPAEIRATAWQCWQRGLRGWLNYGGAQWGDGSARPKTEDPLVWTVPGGSGRGSPWIVYPGQKGTLPSIRFARFRDGVDDYDYLTMLAAKQPNHPVLKQLREHANEPFAFSIRWSKPGYAPYDKVTSMLRARAEIAESLEKLHAGPKK